MFRGVQHDGAFLDCFIYRDDETAERDSPQRMTKTEILPKT